MSTPSQYDLPERVPGPSNSRRDSGNIGLGMKFSGGEDPRRTSSESLRPPPSYDQAQRRKLLLVYIHGFMGNDQSFQKFPYHLHKLLTETIESTHVVHTKIYPRYKTYKAIEVARDNFSTWLQPHESPTTDVVLLGHSMGGLLAADVVTMASPNSFDPCHAAQDC